MGTYGKCRHFWQVKRRSYQVTSKNSIKWKNALRETQTLRTGCSKVEPKIFTPLQTPFPGAQDGQNLISWRWSLLLSTNPVWWRSMHAISSYRGNRPIHKQTHKQTHTQTHRQDQLQYTAPQLASTQCNYLNGQYNEQGHQHKQAGLKKCKTESIYNINSAQVSFHARRPHLVFTQMLAMCKSAQQNKT